MVSLVLEAESSGYIPVVFLSIRNKIAENYLNNNIKVVFIPMPRISRSINPVFYLRWLVWVMIASFRLALRFRGESISAVYANDYNELPALLASRMLGLPSLISIRLAFSAPPIIRRLYMSFILSLTDIVVSCSNFASEFNFRNVIGNKDKILTIYSWCEKSHVDSQDESFDGAYVKYGIPKDAKVILMPARKEPYKGQHVLVDASKKIFSHLDNAYIVFVGSKVEGRGREEYEKRLKDRARELNTCERMVFLEHIDEISILMRAADVVVQSSTGPEAFGMAVMESLFYGTPIVVAKTGGPLEIVGNPPAALLHEPGNADELASSVVRILKDRSIADELVRRGYERAREFTKENQWPRYDRLFMDMLARSPQVKRALNQ